MILTAAEAKVYLGLTGAISDADRALIELLLPKIDAAIAKELRYDPQYRVFSDGEYYPRVQNVEADLTEGSWEVNAAGTRAHFAVHGQQELLQLSTIPVRSIEAIRVDTNGGFGQKPNTFGNDTTWTKGTDYWLDFEAAYLSKSGLVYSNTGWPTQPGSILVKYTAGYTKLELRGRADTDQTDPQTERSGSGINASDIMEAAALTLVKHFKTLKIQAKQGRAGFVAGNLSSESLGKYSYSTDASTAGSLTGMKVRLPAQAREALEQFVHWGVMLT